MTTLDFNRSIQLKRVKTVFFSLSYFLSTTVVKFLNRFSFDRIQWQPETTKSNFYTIFHGLSISSKMFDVLSWRWKFLWNIILNLPELEPRSNRCEEKFLLANKHLDNVSRKIKRHSYWFNLFSFQSNKRKSNEESLLNVDCVSSI